MKQGSVILVLMLICGACLASPQGQVAAEKRILERALEIEHASGVSEAAAFLRQMENEELRTSLAYWTVRAIAERRTLLHEDASRSATKARLIGRDANPPQYSRLVKGAIMFAQFGIYDFALSFLRSAKEICPLTYLHEQMMSLCCLLAMEDGCCEERRESRLEDGLGVTTTSELLNRLLGCENGVADATEGASVVQAAKRWLGDDLAPDIVEPMRRLEEGLCTVEERNLFDRYGRAVPFINAIYAFHTFTDTDLDKGLFQSVCEDALRGDPSRLLSMYRETVDSRALCDAIMTPASATEIESWSSRQLSGEAKLFLECRMYEEGLRLIGLALEREPQNVSFVLLKARLVEATEGRAAARSFLEGNENIWKIDEEAGRVRDFLHKLKRRGGDE